MPLREPVPPPTPFDFIRFLASSITFMARLSEVSVFFDGKRLAHLKKDRGLPRSLTLRKGLKPETPKGTMRVSSVSVTRKYWRIRFYRKREHLTYNLTQRYISKQRSCNGSTLQGLLRNPGNG